MPHRDDEHLILAQTPSRNTGKIQGPQIDRGLAGMQAAATGSRMVGTRLRRAVSDMRLMPLYVEAKQSTTAGE